MKANVDGELLIQLDQALESPKSLVSFISKGNLTRLLTGWSYYGSVNDHDNFNDLTEKMKRLGKMITHVSKDTSNATIATEIVHVRPQVIEYYKALITNYDKFIRKTLSLSRAVLTNHMLQILTLAVQYDGVCAVEFINHFDFNLPVLPKLLTISRNNIVAVGDEDRLVRHNFIVFWTELAGAVAPIHRSELLIQNHKIMNMLWKHMVDADNVATLKIILDFIDTKILAEPAFRRATKCKILNENFMHKIVPVFPRLEKPYLTIFTDLMVKMATDPKQGLAFPVLESQLWHSGQGAVVEVNNKKFTVFNHNIYVLLTSLKPWDQFGQQTVVVEILRHHQLELLAPYMHWMVQNGGGYHDPLLSLWWLGRTLLYTNLLQLEVDATGNAPAKTVADLVAFAPLSKASLTKCLSDKSPMIVQFTLNLIIYTLQRLQKLLVLELCPHQQLVDLVFQTLPEVTKIIELSAKQHPNLTQVLVVKLLRYYDQLYPIPQGARQSLVKLATTGINQPLALSFDFVLLDLYLAILANQEGDHDFKWWQPTKDKHSFFTLLVQLCKRHPGKAESILTTLVKDTVVFSSSLVDSPVTALVRSVSNVVDEAVWGLLDELVSRAMKSPYKYVDIAGKYSKVNVFTVAIVEQFKFALDRATDKSSLLQWLERYLQNLIILGELHQELKRLVDDYFKQDISLGVVVENDGSLAGMLLSPKPNLDKKRMISRYEFGVGLLRFKKEQELLVVISVFTMMSNYVLAIQDPTLAQFVLNCDKFYENVWESPLKRSLINELLLVLTQGEPQTSVVNRKVMKLGDVGDFAWILTNEEINKLVERGIVNDQLAIECGKRALTVPEEWFAQLENHKVAAELVKKGLVHLENVEERMKSPELLEAFISTSDTRLRELVLGAIPTAVTDPELMVFVASLASDVLPLFMEAAKVHAIKLMDKQPLELPLWKQILSISGTDDVSRLFDVVNKNGDIFGFSSQFVSTVASGYALVPEGRKWLHKCMLYITKMYAELSLIPSSFDEFIASLLPLLDSQLWNHVPVAILNTQLEVFANHPKWIKVPLYLEFALKVIEIGGRQVDYKKALQIFISNPEFVLHHLPTVATGNSRHLSARILKKLFDLGPSACSTSVLQEQILLMYLGSTRAEDVVLKSILQVVESKLNASWMALVSEWELSETTESDQNEYEFEEPRLVTKSKTGLVVSLSKLFFNNTIGGGQSATDSEYCHTVYDLEFLLLVIINNEELMTLGEEPKYHISKLVDANLLPLVVMLVGYPSVRPLAATIIGGLVRYLQQEIEIKHRKVYLVYLANILYTLRQEYADNIPHLTWYIYGQFGQILSNPGHFMYEPAYRYVLGHPKLTSRSIPLFPAVADGQASVTTEEQDPHYKQVSWLVATLATGVCSEEDVVLVRNTGVIEWVLNQLNSPYISMRIRSLVLEFVANVQRIPLGIDVLVTRYGSLAAIEQHVKAANNVFDEQTQLNVKKVMVRFSAAGKRVRDWANGDLERVVKRQVKGERN